MRSILFVLSGLFAATPALAAGKNFVSLALSRAEDHSTRAGDKYADDVTIINASVGFDMSSGLVLGGKYFDYSQDNEFLDDTNVVISGWGPMIGYYHQSGFFGAATYLVQPEKEYKADDGKAKYYGGSGYVLEVGKSWPISGNFAAAVQVAQSHVEYKKFKGANAEDSLDDEWSDSSRYPYLTLFVYF